MKIAVLDNNSLDEETAEQFHSYGALIKSLFSDVTSYPITMDVFNAFDSEHPPDIDEYDVFILSGSREDAFGDAPWIIELRKFVNKLISQRKKLIGICFGHQLIAYCLGADVGRADVGWGFGRMSYKWLPSFNSYARGEFSLLVCHQDQVNTVPFGASVIASSDFCPIAAFTVDDYIICFQGHPEFTEQYVAYITDKSRSVLGEDIYFEVMNDLPKGHEGKLVAKLCMDFLVKN